MINPHDLIIPPENSSDPVLEVKLSLEQSKIVEYKDHIAQVLWMITDKKNIGIVVHSEDEDFKLGETTDLSDYELKPFVGSLTINSK